MSVTVVSTERLLDELHRDITECRLCPLCEGRTHAVPGEGNKKTKVMFVGEAPGRDEDLQGRPFVGQAGRLLTTMLAEIGIKREDVFIANVLKCRPPDNRNPMPDEIEACSPYLYAQIAVIKPKVVCPLGTFAIKVLLGKDFPVGQVHGKLYRRHGIFFLPMYHPAALLHRNSEAMRTAMKDDMQKLKNHIAKTANEKRDVKQ